MRREFDKNWQPCHNCELVGDKSEGYNPLDKTNLGISVREALLQQPVLPMGQLLLRGRGHESLSFFGAGVYALYYNGEFPLYRQLKQENQGGKFASPIYVGKAVPAGSRKGGIVKSGKPTAALRDRLRIHAEGISQVTNLSVGDFHFRYLVVDDIWIPLGETYMIEKFHPVWNYVVTGFGIKTPGKRRKGQFTSLWDTLHPGRRFVSDLGLPSNPKTASKIAADIEAFWTMPPEARAHMPLAETGSSDDGDRNGE